MSRLSSAVLLVAIVVLAGCASAPLGGQSTPATSASTGGGGAGSTAAASAGGGSATGASAAAGSSTPAGYTALYQKTIQSVVMIRVTTQSGTVEGSGFVYDDQGHIVTNQHVVESAQSVDVRFRDGQWRTGTVVGRDAYADLAVIHVADVPGYATPLPVAQSDPQPGEQVIAIGSPFGLQGTVTSGIVSGVNRSMSTSNGFSIPDTIQTDAAINPGNSGGPLVATDGTVVGVNRATEGVNVGFAISPEILHRVVPALIDNGQYTHPYVGIYTIDVTPEVARANNLDQATGLLVVRTPTGGPAAGVLHGSDSSVTVGGTQIQTGGDVILAIDGHRIQTQQDLARYLALHTRPGQQVTFTILRNGNRQQVSLTLGHRPSP